MSNQSARTSTRTATWATSRAAAVLAGVAFTAALSGAASPASAATAEASPATSASPAADRAVTSDRGRPTAPRYTLPETLLGKPLAATSEGSYPNGPTVTGVQSCDPLNNPDAPLALSRYTWSYYDPANDASGLSSDVTISTWRNAKQAFTDVVANTGRCGFFEGFTQIPWEGQDPDTHALFTDGTQAAAVIRDGRRIIAVTVMDWDGDLDEVSGAVDAALEIADRV